MASNAATGFEEDADSQTEAAEAGESRQKTVRERALSSINKLMIQGVRGFGAKEEEKAVIEFGKPLTLITGQNGAGKTTIIECLKYITTGDLPPNSKGGAFVHDPKLVNERSVKGVVKLKFKSISGDVIVCHRMLQSTQKPRKIEQKTVDSSLEKIQPDGVKVKITTRCADIDREMVDHLGVSKAILNHVVFCHQEESAWPLSEGKALKAKFDDIFASTRYTKALDNFKKIQQELTSEMRIYKAELYHLGQQKEKVDEVKANLEEAQKKVENSKVDITRIMNELSPQEGRLQDLTNKYDKVTRIEKEITMHESTRQELVRSKQQLESKLESVFTGSKAELRQEHEQHLSVVERSSSELEECERLLMKLVKSVDLMKGRLESQHKEHGRLKTEDQYHRDRIANRDKNIVSTAATYSLPGDYSTASGPISPAKVEQFLQEFAQYKADAKEKADAKKQDLMEKERKVQEQLDQQRTNLAKMEESVVMKKRNITESRGQIEHIGRELVAIGTGAAALEGVEQELGVAETELGDYRGEFSVDSMEEELSKFSEEKQKMSQKAAQLQKELAQLSTHSNVRGAVDELRKQKRAKEETYQLELSSLEPELTALDIVPSLEQDLSRRLRDLAGNREREKKAASDKLRQETSQKSRLQAQQEELEKQLREKRDKMAALQQEVREVCGEESSDSYQDMVDTLQQKIDSASENISTVKGSQSFFRKSLEKLHSNHKCPLCMRGFEDKSSLDSTIKLITTRLNEAIPRMIPRLNTELRDLQEQQKRLQELKPKIEELSNIRTREVPERESALKEKTDTIAAVQAQVETEMNKQKQLERELEQIRSIQPKVSLVSQLKTQLQELDQKISSEEGKLSSLRGGSSRSQHVVSRELTSTQRNIEEMTKKMDDKRQEITECQRMMREMEGNVHRLKEEKLRLQSQMQKRETLVAKKSDLTAHVATLEREVKVETNRITPMREKMEKLAEQREELGQERGVVEAESWSELEHLRVTYDGLKKTSDTISKYVRDGRDKALQECDERVRNLTEQMEAKNTERKELERKKDTLTKQLANAKNRERELTDNLQLLQKQEEIESRARKVRELKASLQSMGLEQYDQEFQRLQADVDRLRKEHARAEGQRLGQEDQVRHLRRELQSDLYCNTEQRHMDMLIKLKTSETASSDLTKYYRALDRAITRFHEEKMREINHIIRELWIKTYKGGDIDRIEIRSDEGAGETGAAISTRRIYNYKVVMIKGHNELDMRGRCSAGQKVLASIIIRLALAETFCLTSGLLALDEPTTNLDRENVEGLAQALTDIIKARSKNQKNFQLIIITHDEAFVELLGHTGYADCFYKVTKEFGKTSKIKRYFF